MTSLSKTAHIDQASDDCAKINQEAQLMVMCAQAIIPPDQQSRIATILSNELDWEYILSIADRNCFLPLLSGNLLQHFRYTIPPAIEAQLTLFLQHHTQRSLHLTSKLILLTKLLDRSGIPSLPFKGPTLALQAYGSLSLRQFGDLDVLIKPRHFDDAVRVLRENGYAAIGETSWLKRKALFFTQKKDLVLIGPEKDVYVELHWKLSGSEFSMPFEINQLWERLAQIDLGGTRVNTLGFEDLFIYLCLHGSRHQWERLSWICDLRELIRASENSGKRIDWQKVRTDAKNLGCERVLQLGLFLVQKFFGVKTDYPGYGTIEANTTFEEIAEQVKTKVFLSEPVRTLSPKWTRYMYYLRLQEKRTNRIKLYIVFATYYLKLLFTPNELDEAIFRLPSYFRPLYWILRPFRLAFSYRNGVSTEPSKEKK